MARLDRFSFLCDKVERQLIADLALKLQRSQSDAVRFVLINAVSELMNPDHGVLPTSNQVIHEVQEAKRESIDAC